MTLRVRNEFEGKTFEIVHEANMLGTLLAEQEASKAARTKFQYGEVVSGQVELRHVPQPALRQAAYGRYLPITSWVRIYQLRMASRLRSGCPFSFSNFC